MCSSDLTRSPPWCNTWTSRLRTPKSCNKVGPFPFGKSCPHSSRLQFIETSCNHEWRTISMCPFSRARWNAYARMFHIIIQSINVYELYAFNFVDILRACTKLYKWQYSIFIRFQFYSTLHLRYKKQSLNSFDTDYFISGFLFLKHPADKTSKEIV